MANPRPSRRERVQQMREVYRVTRGRDSKLPLILAAVFVGVWGVLTLIGFLLGLLVLFVIAGFFIATILTMGVFYRRATSAALREVEGQPGAAAGILNALRGDWQVTPAVAFNANQDVVHRLIGRPGVILVGEGNPGRVRGLLVQERKRVNRVVGPEVPVTEVVVGDDDGQVPLRRLQTHIMRLPRTLKPAQTSQVKKRMRAIGAQPPIPKGPMPRPGRIPRGKMR